MQHSDPTQLARYAWQQQAATAEATERVQQRQIDLLTLQRRVIDDQIEIATRKRADATRAVIDAQKMLDALPTPVDLDELAAFHDLGKLLDNGKPPTDNGEGFDEHGSQQ